METKNNIKKVRSVVLKTDTKYVLKKFGKQGVEKYLKELKCTPKLSSLKWISFKCRVNSLKIIKSLFDLKDKDIEEMGREAVKNSFIIKLFLRYLKSIKTAMKIASKLWRLHYKIGSLNVMEVKKNSIKVCLRGINTDKIFFKYLKGYFTEYIRLTVGKDVKSKMTIKDNNIIYEFKW